MYLNLFILCVTLSMLLMANQAVAKDDKYIEIAKEDMEIINDLDFFEVIEILEEEDTELFENYDVINEVNNDGGQNE